MSRGLDLAKWEAWRRRLRAFDRAKTTVEEFCWRESVSVAAFYQWRRKLDGVRGKSTVAAMRAPAIASRERAARSRPRQSTSRDAVPQPGFVPVEITGLVAPLAESCACIEVLLPGGPKLLVPCHEQQAIRTVIAALADSTAALAKNSQEDRGC